MKQFKCQRVGFDVAELEKVEQCLCKGEFGISVEKNQCRYFHSLTFQLFNIP